MKKLRSLASATLIVAVMGSAFLFGAAGELPAEEVKVRVWDGTSPQAGTKDFRCDITQMLVLLEKDEKVRACTVNAVTKSEPARKLVIKNMFGSAAIREQILDTIASTPALKTMMEAKLAAAK